MLGGIGGLVEYRASLLAARGFAVLALAYFAYDDLPNQLEELDLEYFEEAANLLLAHPKVLKILFILPGNIIANIYIYIYIYIYISQMWVLPMLPVCLDWGIAHLS